MEKVSPGPPSKRKAIIGNWFFTTRIAGAHTDSTPKGCKNLARGEHRVTPGKIAGAYFVETCRDTSLQNSPGAQAVSSRRDVS